MVSYGEILSLQAMFRKQIRVHCTYVNKLLHGLVQQRIMLPFGGLSGAGPVAGPISLLVKLFRTHKVMFDRVSQTHRLTHVFSSMKPPGSGLTQTKPSDCSPLCWLFTLAFFELLMTTCWTSEKKKSSS